MRPKKANGLLLCRPQFVTITTPLALTGPGLPKISSAQEPTWYVPGIDNVKVALVVDAGKVELTCSTRICPPAKAGALPPDDWQIPNLARCRNCRRRRSQDPST
jgi:hypothetical protein